MVRTRIAPSPTGHDLHIGNLYTAYINWAFARKNKGQFIIRVEDTDRERFVEGSEAQILSTLKSYGLTYDEGPDIGGPYTPYRQSERLPIYKEHAEKLVKDGHAYYCFCTKEQLEELRKQSHLEKRLIRHSAVCKNENFADRVKSEPYVIRLKIPDNKEITFKDVIRGAITINSDILDDQVLLKSDGYPTYHLGVVIDDHIMNISHIIRGEEWISSTPKHIMLYEAFGWEQPQYAHVPVLRNPDKTKLSKRKNAVWSRSYLEEGFLPEAVLNYLALMGWSHPDQKEIFTREEFVEKLELEDISPVGPSFDRTKLMWMNGEYIRKMSDEELFKIIIKFIGEKYDSEVVKKTVPLIKERIKVLGEYLPICEFFFKAPEKYEVDLSSKKEVLHKTGDNLGKLDDWKGAKIGEIMLQTAQDMGLKNSEYFMIMRVAVTGKKISPPLNESMELLGKEESLSRLQKIQ